MPILQIVIIQACLKHPKRLFEKFDHKLNRQTQQDAWTEVINDLAGSGIFISDSKYLRKRVTNWVQRATALNDKLKMTGVGRQKPLTPFNELCLDFVRQAKGNTAVDYIASVPEPQGTDQRLAIITSNTNGTPSTSNTLPAELVQRKKKRKIESSSVSTNAMNVHDPVHWRQDLLKHIKETDEKISDLKEYYLFLRNIQIEKELGLSDKEIESLRNQVNPALNRYPRFATEFVEPENDENER